MAAAERSAAAEVLQHQWAAVQVPGAEGQLPEMGEEEMLALLGSDGMLVKRPLLVGDDFVLVGFNEAQWAEKLGI